MAICGIKVRMAAASTAMNGAKFQCCELPISSTTVPLPTQSPVAHSTALTPVPTTESTMPQNLTQGITGEIESF